MSVRKGRVVRQSDASRTAQAKAATVARKQARSVKHGARVPAALPLIAGVPTPGNVGRVYVTSEF